VRYQLDGNAIASDVLAAAGGEMTPIIGRCRKCGTASCASTCAPRHGRPLSQR